MGCAASTTTGTTTPVRSTPVTMRELREHSSEPLHPPQRTEMEVGFETKVVVDGGSILKTLTYPTAEIDALDDHDGAVAEQFSHGNSSHASQMIRHRALKRLSGVFRLEEPVGAVPRELLMLQNRLSLDRFVPLLHVTSPSTALDNSGLHRLCVHSKYFPAASDLQSFLGHSDEKLVEDVFLALCDALSELHGLEVAHLNLHAGNILRVPAQPGATDEFQYLLGDFGWGPFWSALTVSERQTFLKVCSSPCVLSPERVASAEPLSECSSADARIKEDVWAFGALLYQLIYGVVPLNGNGDNVVLDGASEARKPCSGRDLEFPLKGPSGWVVGERWVWLLSSLLTVDPQLRPKDLRIVRDEFQQRTAKRKVSVANASSSTLLQLAEFQPTALCKFPSAISISSETGKAAKRASEPRGRSTVGGGFQLNLASFLLADTDQQSQSTTSLVSSRTASHTPTPASKRSGSLSVDANRSNQSKASPTDQMASPPLALSLAHPGEIFVDESNSIRCIRCDGDLAPLAFRCTQCPEFILCSACFVEHGEDHDPEHCILTFAVERVQELGLGLSGGQSIRGGWRSVHSESMANTSVADESVASLEGSKNLFIPAAALSSHERTVLGMTGKLPAGRQIETLKRKKSAWTLSSTQEITPFKLSPALAGPQVEKTEKDTQQKEAGLCASLTTEHLVGAAEDEIVTHSCAALSATLELCELGLQSVPSCIVFPGKLSFFHVTTLDLANNSIKEIPPELCRLFPSLATFLAGNNQLTSFPESVSELVNLQRLELHRNKLTSMPASIVRLHKLQFCSLDDNDLDVIPDFVWSIPALETVFLALNPRLKRWPPLHVLVDFLDGVGNLQLGLDNAPSLWNVFRTTVSERCPSLTVVWNKIYPDEILPGRLYLGALRSAQSPEVYEELRIGSVLTVGRGLLPKIMPGMSHFTLDVDDLPGSSIVDRFAPCFKFIDEAPELKPDRPGVLVHCWAGMSRSATCVIAYLMQKYQWRLADAYAHTKARREVIQPNDGFMEQLKAYDERLFPCSNTLTKKG